MGVCSVRYNHETIALCPRRFLQDKTVFKDIADNYFKTRNDLVIFNEIGLPHTGTFDFERLAPFAKPDIIKALEISVPATDYELQNGIDRIRKIFKENS